MFKVKGVVSKVIGDKIWIGGHDASLNTLTGRDRKIRREQLSTAKTLHGEETSVMYKAPFNQSRQFYVKKGKTLIVNDPSKLSTDYSDEKVVGLKVMVDVKVQKYMFKSKFAHNKGDIICGWFPVAYSIKPNVQW
jgi:hypothetical protein